MLTIIVDSMPTSKWIVLFQSTHVPKKCMHVFTITSSALYIHLYLRFSSCCTCCAEIVLMCITRSIIVGGVHRSSM